MVELYQDSLLDLLLVAQGANAKKLEIKEGLNGTNYILGVTVNKFRFCNFSLQRKTTFSVITF
jgi:hypothetical protein